MESFIVATAFLIVGLVVFVRMIIPRRVREELAAEVIHDFLQGIWHALFGARKVRIVRNKKRRNRRAINPVGRRRIE